MYSIILVRPQLPSNIGAVARVAKNFNCLDLRIVKPKISFITDQSMAIAVDAVDVLQNAKTFDNLSDAIADLQEAYAFTSRKRFMNKPLIELSDFASSPMNDSKIGLMFGSESSGLSNEEVVFAKKQIFIETNEDFASLNLSHAVAIALHSLTNKQLLSNIRKETLSYELASLKELNDFFNHLEQNLLKTDFLKVSEKRSQMMINIKNIFTRLDNLTAQEVRALRGILTALES